MELDFGELLVAVHLDDEWHSQDQEGGAGDPRRLASATEELLGHDGGFGGGALGVDDDGRLGNVAAGPGYEGLFAFLALGHSLFPLRRRHYKELCACERERESERKGFMVLVGSALLCGHGQGQTKPNIVKMPQRVSSFNLK